MKIRTNTGAGRNHINVKERQDGRLGIVISQSGKTVLMSRQEYLELRAHADRLMGINQ